MILARTRHCGRARPRLGDGSDDRHGPAPCPGGVSVGLWCRRGDRGPHWCQVTASSESGLDCRDATTEVPSSGSTAGTSRLGGRDYASRPAPPEGLPPIIAHHNSRIAQCCPQSLQIFTVYNRCRPERGATVCVIAVLLLVDRACAAQPTAVLAAHTVKSQVSFLPSSSSYGIPIQVLILEIAGMLTEQEVCCGGNVCGSCYLYYNLWPGASGAIPGLTVGVPCLVHMKARRAIRLRYNISVINR
jgi:hypothetical protein